MTTETTGFEDIAAREEQFRGVRLIRLFAGLGYMAAAKAAMAMLGPSPAQAPRSLLQVRPPLVPVAVLRLNATPGSN